MGKTDFWKRVLTDYSSRQVVIEAKNYAQLEPDDYRQILSYTSGEYGRFGMIISRGEGDGLTEHERTWVREMYHEHKRIIFIVPAKTIVRCIKKMRSRGRQDYVENLLSKMLDTYSRSYLPLRSQAPKRSRRRKVNRKKKRR
jgi:hypothetical protein